MPDQTGWQWIRANFDKFLLLMAFFGIMTYVLHMIHHGMDKDNVSWARELAGQAFAAFLTMVTGSLLRGSNTAPPANLPPGSSATTVIKQNTPPDPPPAPAPAPAPITAAPSSTPLPPPLPISTVANARI